MNNVLLVPTDFSDLSKEVIAYAVDMAKHLGFKVSLLHIVNKDSQAYIKGKGIVKEKVLDELQKMADNYADKFKVQVDAIAREGSIFTTISEVAEELNASFVLLGTHGKVGLQQQLFGSYALKVISSSKCPVLVLQEGAAKPKFDKIVFPIDLSSEARQKLAWAVYLGKKFGSTIHLVPQYESEPLRRSKIMNITKQIKNILEKNGVKHVDYVADMGKVGFVEQVFSYVHDVNADMVMIMTHEETLVPIPNFILRPVEEKLIFNADKVPVLCVNPRELAITIIGI